MTPERIKELGYSEIQCVCTNCKHACEITEFDECSQYYCTLNATSRPMCGSASMNETFPIDTEPYIDGVITEWDRMSKEWDDWANLNHVARNGSCNNWCKQ